MRVWLNWRCRFFAAACYGLTLFLLYRYSRWNQGGLETFFGDSWMYGDIAKHIALNHSLALGRVFDIVYPPIYSLVLAPAFLFKDPKQVFLAVRWINILVYSLSFFPIYGLCRGYAKLSHRQAGATSVLFTLFPGTIQYVITMMSENAFIPLVFAVTYLFSIDLHLQSRAKSILFGLVLALLPLTKATGFAVVASFAIVGFIQAREAPPGERARLAKSFGLALAACLLAVMLEKIYVSSMNPKNGADLSTYFLTVSDPMVLSPKYWLMRLRIDFFWFLASSLTGLVTVSFAIFFASPKKFIASDPVACLIVGMPLITCLIIPPFTSSDGLVSLHDRYLYPYLFPSCLIALRYYRERFTRKILAVSLLLYLLYFFVAKVPILPPYVRFLERINVRRFPKEVIEGTALYSMALVSGLYLLKKNLVPALIANLLVVYPVFLIGSGRNPSTVTQFGDPEGISRMIEDILQRRPETRFYVDDRWRAASTQNWVNVERIMLGVRRPPEYICFKKPFGIPGNEPWLYLTSYVSDEGRLLKGAGDQRLYANTEFSEK